MMLKPSEMRWLSLKEIADLVHFPVCTVEDGLQKDDLWSF